MQHLNTVNRLREDNNMVKTIGTFHGAVKKGIGVPPKLGVASPTPAKSGTVNPQDMARGSSYPLTKERLKNRARP